MDDKYLSPYQTRAHWLSWLLRKSRVCKFKFRALGPITPLGLDYQKAYQGPMGYQFAEYGSCAYCSSVARGDIRERLKEEKEKETEEKTKHHNHKMYAGLHPGIDNFSRNSKIALDFSRPGGF